MRERERESMKIFWMEWAVKREDEEIGREEKGKGKEKRAKGKKRKDKKRKGKKKRRRRKKNGNELSIFLNMIHTLHWPYYFG
jgi:hypothetical protein